MNRRYLAKRLAQVVISIYVVLTLTFVLIQWLPGDARDFVQAISAGQGNVGQAYMRTVGLDPEGSGGIVAKYVDYMSSVLQGDLGTSVYFQEPVLDILVRALPWTVFVVSIGLALTYSIGIALGAVMAYKEGSRFDSLASTVGIFLNSIPYFIAGIVMLWILGYQMQLFPTSGRKPQGVPAGMTSEFVFGVLYHAALPIASIVITAFGFRALSMRGNSIQVLGEEYVRVADLRGLPDRRIALQYVGRNAVLPMYTGFILALGFVLGNSIILERVFQYQGIGFYLFRALEARDYPLLMGSFLVITTTVIVGLFVADITYGFIDPRAASGSSSGSSSGSRVPVRYRLRVALTKLRRLPQRVRNPGGDDTVANGGVVTADAAAAGVDTSLFETTSDVTLSRRERYLRAFDEYVRAPTRIVMSDRRSRIGLVILLFYVGMATVGVRLLATPEPNQGPLMQGAFQTAAHPLGTDILGRDILAMVVYSTEPILKMMFAGALFATTVGTLVGLMSGYSGGLVDRGLMGITDITLAIPGIPLVLVLAVIFAPEDPVLVGLLLTVNAWGGIARQVRSQVLTIADESYVEASGIMSLGLGTILLKDIMPNIAPFVLIRGVQAARQVIFAALALYYLGALEYATVNWGVMIREVYDQALYSFDSAHWVLPPMIAIAVLVYGLIMFAQGMDRIFNPRVRARHAETLEADSEEAEQSTPPGTIAGGD